MGVGKPRDSCLVATALGSKRRMRRDEPSYLAKHPAPRVLSDLAQHQCITTIELQPWTFQTGQQERTPRGWRCGRQVLPKVRVFVEAMRG